MERKQRANEIRDRNFEKPILHYKRGEPVIIPEGFRTHKFPESIALGGKVPEHYEEIYGDAEVELKAQSMTRDAIRLMFLSPCDEDLYLVDFIFFSCCLLLEIVAREMDAKIAQLDAILKERALSLAQGSDS